MITKIRITILHSLHFYASAPRPGQEVVSPSVSPRGSTESRGTYRSPVCREDTNRYYESHFIQTSRGAVSHSRSFVLQQAQELAHSVARIHLEGNKHTDGTLVTFALKMPEGYVLFAVYLLPSH